MKWKSVVAASLALILVVFGFSAHIRREALASPRSIEEAGRRQAIPAVIGQWSSPIFLGIVPIHAATLYTGQVLFWEYLDGTGANPGTIAILFDPVAQAVTCLPSAPAADFFCSGATQLPDGTVLMAGGLSGPLGAGDIGTTNATVFDPVTSTFNGVSDMNFARYYPTSISLPDGTQLVMSGEDATGTIVKVMEIYDPVAQTWTRLPTSANLPKTTGGQVWNDYPRDYLMTSGQVFVTNQMQFTFLFDPTSMAWTSVGNFNNVNRFHAAGVVLPSLQQVMTIGGQPPTGSATNTTEMIDFTQQAPSWQYSTPMLLARHDMNAINLPDGTILVVGGVAGEGKYQGPVKPAEIYSPVTNSWTMVASQMGSRGYHSTALLLPDGRVISAGSDSGDIYQSYAEIYSPPYLFNGTQPTITSAPTAINYGQVFTISTPNDASISSVAFIRLDATTHADHMDQRMQNLAFSDLGSGTLQITAPPNSNYAPPGNYMLFIVNASGVPSVSAIMQISSSGTDSSHKPFKRIVH